MPLTLPNRPACENGRLINVAVPESAQAGSSRFALSGPTNTMLVGFVVLAMAAAAGIAADMGVHLLGSEARARRKG